MPNRKTQPTAMHALTRLKKPKTVRSLPKKKTERKKSMKITIDRDGCISCGNCEANCPQVFKLQVEGDGKSAILEPYGKGDLSNGEVGDDLKNCVETARDGCPVQVISTE